MLIEIRPIVSEVVGSHMAIKRRKSKRGTPPSAPSVWKSSVVGALVGLVVSAGAKTQRYEAIKKALSN